jgi:hypothetical protein
MPMAGPVLGSPNDPGRQTIGGLEDRKRLCGLRPRVFGAQNRKGQFRGVKPAAGLEREALQHKRRGYATVSTARLATVQLATMLTQIGVDRGLEPVPVQPLKQIGLNAGAVEVEVDVAGGHKFQVRLGFPHVPQNAGEQPERPSALVEILRAPPRRSWAVSSERGRKG